MPPTRYPEEAEYGREPPRGIRRPREVDAGDRERERREPAIRDVRADRAPPRGMDIEPQRLAREPDLLRGEQQRLANSGVPRQQDVRVARNVPATRDRDDEMMYDVPRTQYPAREQPARRTPYEGEFDEIPASIRPVIDPSRSSRDEPRPNYNEYFLPGDGIDREVIQSEICRYLGQDATCKPGTHGDGRRGYIIRAYRALTTEMIRSLKEDSGKYARERETAARNRRMPVPYATVRDQTRYGGDEMMLDEPDDRERDRYPRHVEETRLRNPAVTSAYVQEAGYSPGPAFYPVTATQTAPPGYDPRDPRYVPGNTTPPGVSGRNPGYAAGYAAVTTRPSIPSIPAAAPFQESRPNPRDTGHGYPPEPRARYR